MEEQPLAPAIDITRPSVARMYDYYLGGKDNFAVDRAAVERVELAMPEVRQLAMENRAFLRRAVRFMAAAGIRQFLDIGAGLPTAGNTHEVAQRAAPDARVVYVDNDPIVLVHARALLASRPEGATDYVDADLRDPGKILGAAAGSLDLGQPVALMLMAILQHIGDEDDPYQVVATLVEALAPGSYLAISHPASDINAEAMAKMAASLNQTMAERVTFRSRDAVVGFFTGLDLVEPGLVQASKWRPATREDADRPAALWAGVAAKK